MTNFVETLKELLIENNLMQKDFAAKIEIKPSTITQYLSGHQLPTLEIAVKIAAYFNCTMDYLFGEEDIAKVKVFRKCPPFNTRFRFLMKHFKKTQVELNKTAHISKSAIYYWLSGKRVPAMDSIIKLAKFFNCSIDFVIGRVDFD